LFDVDFSYTASTLGYGWEDIEMGYRLYKRGVRIKYSDAIFTVHMSHNSSISNEATIPVKSLRNFRRMHEKHPEMKDIVRSWTMFTYKRILQWCKNYNHDLSSNEDYIFLQNHFRKNIPYIYEPREQRRLKILTYCWHVPHQYELHKLPHDFTLIQDIGTHHCYKWAYAQRPFPDNDTMQRVRDINIRNYDLAIFHFDENCLNFENTNGVLGANWGENFKYFVENVTGIPKIGVCHGTPQFVGAYTPNYTGANLMQPIESSRQNMVNYLKDIMIICNSHQSEREWGFNKSKVIWHGFDPAEFPRSTYRKKVTGLTNMIGRPHYRGLHILNEVNSHLPNDLKINSISTPEPIEYKVKEGNEYAFSKYRNYIDTLREYSIYFNPTIRSPMPRSRTEAMMCGLVTVSYKTHDVDMFIKNKINGFYSEHPSELAEFIVYLANNESAFEKISDASYQTAIDVFNNDRYLHEWKNAIFSIVG
jgi:glycosyltransferase involved in cell wall biosynthesis